MQIEDIGFFLGTKEYGENSFIVFVLSKKHGLSALGRVLFNSNEFVVIE